jgi:hypothetical protein
MNPELSLLPRLVAAQPLLADLVGRPVVFSQLKPRGAHPAAVRARGPQGCVIVKVHRPALAAAVAARLRWLALGPAEPVIPQVLMARPDLGLLILTQVGGDPLRHAILAGDRSALWGAGAAVATWHQANAGAEVGVFRAQTLDRELELLARLRAQAPRPIAQRVDMLAPALQGSWPCSTVVHRDLGEERILVGDLVGLIDLDDVGLGPPELDVGNLLAHLSLLASRERRSLEAPARDFLRGYVDAGGDLDADLVARCTGLSALRLACIHADPRMLDVAAGLADRSMAGAYLDLG